MLTFLAPRLLCVAALAQASGVADEKQSAPYQAHVAAASDEAVKAIAQFRLPAGLRVEVFAAEPLLANPVAIAPDEHNRFYVVETFRHSAGVTDTRGHMNWLVDDLAARSVEDRVAMYKKYLTPEEFETFGVHHDRLRLVEDRDGDGRAETSSVFAEGFSAPETGLAAGVLARRGDVYFACIPDLWRLRDSNGDGHADEKKSLHSGYGVHVQFIGHDLHGLLVGPDGRLYFTVGDRGLNVTTNDGKKLAWPDSGAVLRCELDGTNLEIVHVGLRNPQELAFDDAGNLFTVDNNSDGGDRARLVWIVPGGDSGWRGGFQYLERPTSRGPWNAEKMWQPQNDAQPAFLVPPLANFSDGPSGLAFNPGTALRAEDRGRFYLADFRGSAGNSGVRSFAVRPKGAAFELVDETQFLWGLEATDVAFGTDGALYVADWVEGWNTTGKGRIYKVSDPESQKSDVAGQTRALIAEGMSKRNIREVERLLDHDDQRVRLEAQFELVARANNPDNVTRVEALHSIQQIASGGNENANSVRARRHAIWAWGQVERGMRDTHTPFLLMLMSSEDPAIRVEAMKTLAEVIAHDDLPLRGALPATIAAALNDAEPRVRFYAGIAAGALGDDALVDPIRTTLAENADADAYSRHAGVMGLAGIARKKPEPVLALAGDESSSVRLAVLLAHRRLGSAEVGRFLHDADARVVLEAARAIYDVPIEGAMPALAALPIGKDTPTPLMRRVVAAKLRVGDDASADSLGAFAILEGLTSSQRVEALDALAEWSSAAPLDRITGLYRPQPERPASGAMEVLARVGPQLLDHDNEVVVQAVIKGAATLRATSLIPKLITIANDSDRSPSSRVESLKALDAFGTPELGDVVRGAVRDSNRAVRAEALAILARVDPAEAIQVLAEVIRSGANDERQRAFSTLGTIEHPGADELVLDWLNQLATGKVPAPLQLDVLEAAEKRKAPTIKQRLGEYEAGLATDDPIARFVVALEGGRASRGERIYRENAAVSCVKCHKIRGQGGEVGPELTGIGAKKSRRELLEAIVTPDKQIAEGFDTKVIALKDGTIHAGIVKASDDRAITLINADAQVLVVPRDDIDEETRGQSAMPQDLVQKLSRGELRDLIEYLAGLK